MPTSSELVKRIDAVTFPAAPAVLARLSQLLSEEWVTGEQLAEVVALDAGISARVLRVSNSVVFRGGGGVKSIADAVLRIGVDTVRDLVFALSAARVMRPVSFDLRLFWRHSLAVAQGAQIVQRRALNAQQAPTELYAAALLHDIGMLVMDRALGAEYTAILEKARGAGKPLFEVEREILGTDHAEVGGRLLEVWRLPSSLVEPVQGHHEPLNHENLVVYLVHLADFICNHEGIHNGTGYRPESCAPEVWDELGVADLELPEIAAEMQAGLAKADAIIAATK